MPLYTNEPQLPEKEKRTTTIVLSVSFGLLIGIPMLIGLVTEEDALVVAMLAAGIVLILLLVLWPLLSFFSRGKGSSSSKKKGETAAAPATAPNHSDHYSS